MAVIGSRSVDGAHSDSEATAATHDETYLALNGAVDAEGM
jgi:hypothetical protein